MRDVFKIGLTGGFGTGKSTVLKYLARQGVSVLDADAIAHDVIAPGQKAYSNIVRIFGNTILKRGGQIDRPKLANIIFSDERHRRTLNRIVHPLVIKRIAQFLAQQKKTCAVSVPLLYETGLEKLFDTVVVVKARQGVVLERMSRSRGLARKDAMARIRAQWPLARKCRLADTILDNNGSWEDLRSHVKGLLKKL